MHHPQDAQPAKRVLYMGRRLYALRQHRLPQTIRSKSKPVYGDSLDITAVFQASGMTAGRTALAVYAERVFTKQVQQCTYSFIRSLDIISIIITGVNLRFGTFVWIRWWDGTLTVSISVNM